MSKTAHNSINTVTAFRLLPRGTILKAGYKPGHIYWFIVISPKYDEHREQFVEHDAHHAQDMMVCLKTGLIVHWSEFMGELTVESKGLQLP